MRILALAIALVLLGVAFGRLFCAADAVAAPSPSALPYPGSNAAKLPAGSTGVSVATPGGPRGPSLAIITSTGDTVVEMDARRSGYAADIVVRNDGNAPLEISSASLRGSGNSSGDVNDGRVPENVEVRVGESAPGSLIVLGPGQLRHVAVTWAPNRTQRLVSFYAQLMIESNDPTAHVKAIGLHAQAPAAFSLVTAHPISWLLLLPLFGAAFALYVQLSKKTKDEKDAKNVSDADDRLRVHRVALGSSAAQLAVAVWTYFAFDTDLTRLDGNDGLQFVERGVLLRGFGVESFFAVDGLNIASLVVVPLATVLALLALGPGQRADRARDGQLTTSSALVPLVLVLSSAAIGVFTSFDVAQLLAFLGLTGVAATLLLSRSGAATHRVRALRLAWGAAFVVLAVVIWTLRAHSGANFLVDGGPTAHTTSIPELARAAFAANHETAFGASLVKLAAVGLVVGFLFLLPFGPLGSSLAAALAEAPLGVALSIGGSTLGVGAYGILRLLAGMIPEGARWAAPSLAALGAFGLLYGVIAARGEADPTRRQMTLAAALGCAALVGLGALTPEGIRGALLAIVAPSLAFLFVALARTSSPMPRSSSLARVLALGSFAAAGTIGPALWSLLLVALGAFPSSPIAAVASFLALVVAASIAWRAPSPSPSPSSAASARVHAPALVLAALLLLLTVWPTPLFMVQGAIARQLVEVLDPPGPDQIAQRDIATP